MRSAHKFPMSTVSFHLTTSAGPKTVPKSTARGLSRYMHRSVAYTREVCRSVPMPSFDAISLSMVVSSRVRHRLIMKNWQRHFSVDSRDRIPQNAHARAAAGYAIMRTQENSEPFTRMDS